MTANRGGILEIGPFASGEVPEALVVAISPDEGNEPLMSLEGFSAKWRWAPDNDLADFQEREAQILDEEEALVTYVWTQGDLPNAGQFTGQVTVHRDGDVDNPELTLKSRYIRFAVDQGLGQSAGPPPDSDEIDGGFPDTDFEDGIDGGSPDDDFEG